MTHPNCPESSVKAIDEVSLLIRSSNGCDAANQCYLLRFAWVPKRAINDE